MRSTDKKLIALLASMIAIVGVIVILLVQIYKNESSAPRSLQYIPAIGNEQTSAGYANTLPQNTNAANASAQNVGGNNQNQTLPNAAANAGNQAAPNNQPQQQNAGAAVSLSAMSSEQILELLTNAVNKTKAYTGNLSVYHSESFQANVTECTGGTLVAKAVNILMGMVVKPTEETLSFSGGTAVNSEGETATILLPQKGGFRLTMSGISSISAYADGQNTVVSVSLIPESVGMYETPAANAAGVGFLDVSKLDLSFLEVTKADIRYTGSTIKAVIAPSGYVNYAEYTIPLHVEGSAHAGPISGSAVFDGMQTEIWNIGL